jgi:hypothetical protein
MRLVRLSLCALSILLPLGGSVSAQHVPDRLEVKMDVPDAVCHRSNKAWASQPISIAVLDFGYPGQLEPTHSGVALADMVYGRLSADKTFAFSRGDWMKMGYDDATRVAALGRVLGVDAVLAGTWEFENGAAPAMKRNALLKSSGRRDPLRMAAGLVDTCTGELLLKMTSDGSGQPLTADAALNPHYFMQDLDGAIDRMISPLGHMGDAPTGDAAVVKTTDQAGVTVQLPAGSPVKVGDQLIITANRIGKDIANYSLHNLTHQEIGKMTVQQVAGNTASGVFSGAYSPMTGDLVSTSQRQ